MIKDHFGHCGTFSQVSFSQEIKRHFFVTRFEIFWTHKRKSHDEQSRHAHGLISVKWKKLQATLFYTNHKSTKLVNNKRIQTYYIPVNK